MRKPKPLKDGFLRCRDYSDAYRAVLEEEVIAYAIEANFNGTYAVAAWSEENRSVHFHCGYFGESEDDDFLLWCEKTNGWDKNGIKVPEADAEALVFDQNGGPKIVLPMEMVGLMTTENTCPILNMMEHAAEPLIRQVKEFVSKQPKRD